MSETIFNPSDFNSDAASYPTHELNEDTEQTIPTGAQTGATSDKTADPVIREESSVKNAGGDGNIHSDNFGSAQNQFQTTANTPYLEVPSFEAQAAATEEMEGTEAGELEDVFHEDGEGTDGTGTFHRKGEGDSGAESGAGGSDGGSDQNHNKHGVDLDTAKQTINSGIQDAFGDKSAEVLNILNSHGISEEQLMGLIGKEFMVNGQSFQINSFADAMNYLNATEGMNFTLLTVDILNATGIDIGSVGIDNLNQFGMDRKDVLASLMGEVQTLFGPSFTVDDLQALLSELDMSVDDLVEIMGKPMALDGTEGPAISNMNQALLKILEGREEMLVKFYERVLEQTGIDLATPEMQQAQQEVVNFLKILASILAFLVVVKNEIMQLDSTAISAMNQAKLDLNEIKTSIADQNVFHTLNKTMEDYETFVENKEKAAEQQACQTALKIIMPIVTVLVAIVAIVGAVFTGGASLALVAAMIAITVAVCALSLTDQLMEGGMWNKVFDAVGIPEDAAVRAVAHAFIELLIAAVATILTLGICAAVIACTVAKIFANSAATAINIALKVAGQMMLKLMTQLATSLGTRLGALLIIDVVSQFLIGSNLAAEVIVAIVDAFYRLGDPAGMDEETKMWLSMTINITLSVLTIGLSLGVAFGSGSKAVKQAAEATEEVGTGLADDIAKTADDIIEAGGSADDIARQADDIAEEATETAGQQADDIAEGVGGLGTAAKSATGLAGAASTIGGTALDTAGRASRSAAETALDAVMDGIKEAQKTMKKILEKIMEAIMEAISKIKGAATSFKNSAVGQRLTNMAEFVFKKLIPGILGFEGGEHLSRSLDSVIGATGRKTLEFIIKFSNFLHETAIRFNAAVQISVAVHQLEMLDKQAANIREQAAWQYIVDTFNSFDDWFTDLIEKLRGDMANHMKSISDFAKIMENYVSSESKANDALFNAVKT